MPISLIYLRDLNTDPLPGSDWIDALYPGVALVYGAFSGGDTAFDSADTDTSYGRIGYANWPDLSGRSLITARLVADPPIPSSAVGVFDPATYTHIHMQGRTPEQSPRFTAWSSRTDTAGGGTVPPFRLNVFSWVGTNSLFTDGAWHAEVEFGSGDFYGYDHRADDLVHLIQAGGYVALDAATQFTDEGVDMSQIIAAVAWFDEGVKWHTVGGHFATPGGVTPQILTPGVGWVDVVDGPA